MTSTSIKLDLLNDLILKLNHKADIHEEWAKDKERSLQSRDFRNYGLNDVKIMSKRHEIMALDLESNQNRVKQILSMAQDLDSLAYFDSVSVNSRCKAICNQWDRLLILNHQKCLLLKSTERVLQRVDDLHLEFAKKVVPLNNWLDTALLDLMDVFVVNRIKSLQELADACEQFKIKLLEAEAQHFSILSLSREIDSIVSYCQIPEAKNNPYTQLTAQLISDKWSEVIKLVPRRDQNVESHHLKRQISESLCRIFAGKANIVGPWIDRQTYSVMAIVMEVYTTLEEQLSKLSQHFMAVKLYRPHMDELETIHNEIKTNSVIKENRYTHYKMQTLREGWYKLMSSIRRNISEIENQIEIRDSKGITTEQLKWFRISFKRFANKKGSKLSEQQFKSCLSSLGYRFAEDTGDYVGYDFERVMSEVDPNNTRFVTFNAFLHFVTENNCNDFHSLEIFIQSFQILSSNKPYITAEELRQQLNAKEAEYCIKRMKPYDKEDGVPGALDYILFSKALYEKEKSFIKRNVSQNSG